MGQNEQNAKSGTSIESCSLLLQTSLHFTTDILSAKSRVCICKHFVNKLPPPAVRRCNSFFFYGIAAAMGLHHTNGNIGVTISNIRPECFSFSLPLLQSQKRFLATSANKSVCDKPSCPLFTTTTVWCGRVGKAGHKKMDKTFALPNLHKQSPHLYSILIRRKCPLSALKISGCII